MHAVFWFTFSQPLWCIQTLYDCPQLTLYLRFRSVFSSNSPFRFRFEFPSPSSLYRLKPTSLNDSKMTWHRVTLQLNPDTFAQIWSVFFLWRKKRQQRKLFINLSKKYLIFQMPSNVSFPKYPFVKNTLPFHLVTIGITVMYLMRPSPLSLAWTPAAILRTFLFFDYFFISLLCDIKMMLSDPADK